MITQDDERRLVLQKLDGNMLALLEPRYDSFRSCLTISPSTHRVAMLRRNDDATAIITVWDGDDGRSLGSFHTAGSVRGGVACAHDEAAIFVMVRDGRENHLQRFAL